jgi:hypothetical protein
MVKLYTCLTGEYEFLHSDLNFRPYKIQVVQQLSDHDKEVHMQFCHQLLELMAGNPDMPDNILMSHEAHFYLHGVINKQKPRYWVMNFVLKVTVWYAVSPPTIIGPYFFFNKDG